MSSKRKKDDPAEMAAMNRWLKAVCAELGVDPAVIDPISDPMLDLIREIAHGPSRPGGPMTSYIIGLAAASDPEKGPGMVAEISDLVGRYVDEEN